MSARQGKKFRLLHGRRVNQTTIFLVVLFTILSFLLLGAGCGNRQSLSSSTGSPSPAKSETILTMGTSSIGSNFYVVGVGMADMIIRHTGIKVTVEPVGGSDANIRALKDKKLDLAIVNADSAVNAFNGTRQFKAERKIPISLLAQGQLAMRPIVARANAGIQTPADLNGKRFVARRKAMAEVELVGRTILKTYGVPWDKVKIIETAEVQEAIEAMKLGSVDAAIIPSGVPNANLTDLSQSMNVIFLSISDDKLKSILDDLGPAFRKGVIPAGTYKGQNHDVTVPAMSSLLVARPGLSQDVVYQVVKTLMDNSTEFKAVHNSAKYWNVQNSLASPPIPFASGAVRYYKEAGVWKEGLQEEQ